MQSDKSYQNFRKIAKFEGISYLALLFIAMPLKYMANLPMAVTVVGSVHGLLFILFIVWMYIIYDTYSTNLKWMIKAFLASIIPFGTFVMDKEWKVEANQMKNEK
jgi:integral membrane protein